MRDLNAPCSNLELHVLTRLLDVDKDGQLDYNEFAKGVRYFKPEDIIADDGLPVLRISRKDLECCQYCKLKVWQPNDIKFPRYRLNSYFHQLIARKIHWGSGVMSFIKLSNPFLGPFD